MKRMWFCLLLLLYSSYIVLSEEGSCFIPTELPQTLGLFNDTTLLNEICKGSYVPPSAVVIYKCKDDSTLNGVTENFCSNGNWTVPTHPECIKFCSPVSGISINATCSLDNENISCLQPHRPGTTVNISCAFGYQEPENESVENVLRCGEDGKWNFPVFQCEQICGRQEPDFKTFVTKDRVEYVITVPWHVVIYSNAGNEDYYKAICDGTILNAKMVISVAHCFWDKAEKKFYDPSTLNMVPGKYFQYSYQGWPVKSQSVAQINYYKDFHGEREYYPFDIVLLVLEEHFVFEVSLAPICVDTALSVNDNNLDSSGEILGWIISVSEGLRTHALKLTNASVFDFSECVTKFSTQLSERNVRRDKFCVKYTKFGTFQPSNGGSFVTSNKVDDRNVYTLRGIFSNSRPDKNRRTINVLLTNVQHHTSMIEMYLNKTDDVITCPDVSNADPTVCGHFSNNTEIVIARPTIEGSCLFPYDLSDALTLYYNGNGDQQIAKGTYAVPYAVVLYRCERNYTLIGSSDNFCFNGNWTVPNHPNCLKFCSPKPLHGITITATCEFNGEQIRCQQSHQPGTIAHISCALGYRRPADRVSTDVLYCGENGEWDFPSFRCEQVCGVEAPEIVPYVVGGDYVNITKVPWHVGIYSNIKYKNYFYQICGGTIMNAKVVISAAHCFWDSSENRFLAPSDFKVAAGKYYRDLYQMEPLPSQTLDVEKIYNKPEYIDYAGYYALDIVLLVLKEHIQFNSYIKPICVEYDLNFNEQQVQPGSIGKVAGWGLEASESTTGSKELKVIELPAIEYNECKRVLPVELLPFITGDKFCAGYTTGESVCRGDSGGGLVFPKLIGSETVYFLRGIVSTGNNKAGSCDNDKYTLFTNIQYHIKMISFYESHNRP